MNSVKLIISAFVVSLIALIGYDFIKNINPQSSELDIQTSTPAEVFLNGRDLGKTPYDAAVWLDEGTIKLIPLNDKLSVYEDQVKFEKGVKTIVRRDLESTNDASSGEIISLQKTAAFENGLSIITFPEDSQITIDGKFINTSPATLSNISEGSHGVKISKDGYEDKNTTLKITNGYILTDIIKLSKIPSSSNSSIQNPDYKQSPN